MELVWMEENFGERLKHILLAFENSNADVWRFLDIQVDDQNPDQLMKSTLFGYAWSSDVPWENIDPESA